MVLMKVAFKELIILLKNELSSGELYAYLFHFNPFLTQINVILQETMRNHVGV